jgi:predicted phosphodiesterase
MKKQKIYFCGDTHGSVDFEKLENFFDIQKDEISKNDFLIQLGDFGFIWKSLDDTKQRVDLEYLASQNITFCVVLGNHENYDEIEKLPIIHKKITIF